MSNVTVDLGKTRALENLSLNVNAGEIFGLIGRNGSGKTTALKVLCGLLKPKNGNVFLDGQQVNTGKNEFKKMIGYCPQENSFFEKLTVRENMKYFAKLYDVEQDTGKLIESISKSLCLEDQVGVLAANLSGGMKRRLNIACTLMHEPQIILMDEPSIELDPVSKGELWKLIKLINRTGTTIIISSNNMEEIHYLCDMVTFLENGRKVYEGAPNDVLSVVYSREFWL